MEKLLFVTIVVLLFALVVVVALAVNRILRTEATYRSEPNVCNTPACIRYSLSGIIRKLYVDI